MVSKKQSIRKSKVLTHDLAIQKILKFFNDVRTPDEIVSTIRDDPTFEKSNGAYGIRKSTANNILNTRAKLPGNRFSELKQIDKIYGVGPDTINDIFYSFYSDIIKERNVTDKSSQIIVDFVFENNLLYIIIENIGDSVVNKVSIKFDKKFLGLNKEKNISDLRIFRNISVFPPKKKFKIFVDTFSSYVKNKQPLVLTSKITYYHKKRHFYEMIKHDLAIYKDFVETLNPSDGNFT